MSSSIASSSTAARSATEAPKSLRTNSNGTAIDKKDSESDEDKRVAVLSEKDRKIGHRRINEEGEVSYKKIQSNQLIASIQLGIQYSIGVMTKYDDRDLLMQDFMTVETNVFPKNGGHHTPAHTFSDFKFSTFGPLAFRYFLNLFGIKREDFMMSICNDSLRELSNPGASGSLFFLTNDDEFILKTVQHKEAEFLQKLLPGYYMNLNQNRNTLLPKFFGMFVYQCNQKNIRLTVMNNLLPSDVKMHLKFDLKGSTYKRMASKRERAKSSPTYKDLDLIELLPEGVLLEPEPYNALISTLRRDCRVLESFRIMDYSLLIGIHNLDLAAKEEGGSGEPSPTRIAAKERAIQRARLQKQKLVAHSTAMESIQAQTEPIDEEEHLPPGGIPARNHKGERLLLYLGIIDILQSYRIRKKIEHTLKAIIHDGDTVSVHRPGFYAHRFLDFMADKVFKKIPSLDLPEIKGTHRKFRSIVSSIIALKHSPSKKVRKEMALKKTSTTKTSSNDDNVESSKTPDNAGIGVGNTVCGATSATGFSTVSTKPEVSFSSSQKDSKQPNKGSPTHVPSDLPANASKLFQCVDKVSAGQVSTIVEAGSVGAASGMVFSDGGSNIASTDLNQQQPETLNLPAVLWDRPAGSKIRVPPPVPPRSPRRPIDPVASGAFEAAMAVPYGGRTSQTNFTPQRGDLHYPSSRLSSSQRPDVVPGNSIQEEETIFQESTKVAQSSPGIDREFFIDPTMHRESYMNTSTTSSSQHYSHEHSSISSSHKEITKVVTKGNRIEHSSGFSGTAEVNNSPSLPRKNRAPPHRQTLTIKNQSADSLGSDHSSMSNKGTGSFGGTPSRLSAGRGVGSGNTPSPANTWNTEATPSYTASSLSGPGSLGPGVTGPAAGVGQSSLDDVCDWRDLKEGVFVDI